MHPDTAKYNAALAPADRSICDLLAREIGKGLPEAENEIWHAHPVWFLEGNPVVGYSKLKGNVRLLFWSGQSFDEEGLQAEGSFKAAEARYTAADQVDKKSLKRWLVKARDVQWDYKNIVRNRGLLKRLGRPSDLRSADATASSPSASPSRATSGGPRPATRRAPARTRPRA